MDIKEIDILGDDIDNHWYYKSKVYSPIRKIRFLT